jgi:hypothetical protein
MAVDVYVMPLWRFKAGDFSSPIETALGVKPTVIALQDFTPAAPPWYLRLLARLGLIELETPEQEPSAEERRAMAIRSVDELKHEMTRLVGDSINWADAGEVIYHEQFHEPARMRAFAAWFDHRGDMPEFTEAPNGNFYDHPVWKLRKPSKRRFGSLVEHSFYNGYLLPVPFDGVYQVEPFNIHAWQFFHSVSSTQTVAHEVSELLQAIDGLPPVNGKANSQALMRARESAEQLKEVCAHSMERALPAIFHG